MTHFYAVANGTEIGVFNSWKDCKQSVLHYPNATFKKCSTQKEAEDYIRRNVDVRTITHNTPHTPTRLAAPPTHRMSNHHPRATTSRVVVGTRYVYTDGACIHNGKRNARAGAGVYYGENDARNLSTPVEGAQTNNAAEATALLLACKQIATELVHDPTATYVIVSDSHYAIQYATHWGKKHERCGWMKEVANKELLRELYKIASGLPLTFLHVKAHTNRLDKHSLGNQQADILARKGISVGSGTHTHSHLKVFLNVPYEHKNKAKELGARWDSTVKKWYTHKKNRHYSELIQFGLQ